MIGRPRSDGLNLYGRELFYLSGIGHAVLVKIEPKRDIFKLRSFKPSVIVFIERGERLVSILPRFVPGMVAEKLIGGLNHTGLFRIPDD